MAALGGPELQSILLIQLLQSNPIFLVYLSIPQVSNLAARNVRLRKPRALLWDNCLIIVKQIHDELIQTRQILCIRRVLLLPLVIDVGQEIRVLEVLIRGLAGRLVRAAEVLRGHEVRLHPVAPRVRLQQPDVRLAQPVRSAADLVLGDAVMLAAEGDKVVHARHVAPLDETAEELAALREAERVDCRRRGDDRMRREVGAYFGDLLREVAEEGSGFVRIGVLVYADVVHKSPWVRLDCEVAD